MRELRGFARELTAQFERDLEVSERIEPDRWRRRGPLQRGETAALKFARRELWRRWRSATRRSTSRSGRRTPPPAAGASKRSPVPSKKASVRVR